MLVAAPSLRHGKVRYFLVRPPVLMEGDADATNGWGRHRFFVKETNEKHPTHTDAVHDSRGSVLYFSERLSSIYTLDL